MDRCETLPVPYTLESAGVDYLTATAYRTSNNSQFDALGQRLVEAQAGLGHEVKTWKSAGYHGLITDGVIRGVRHDTHIIKLSSDMAHDHWSEVAELATNISRLDVEITFRFETPQRDFFRFNHGLAVESKTGRGRRRNVTLIQSTSDGDSLYLGKRSSDLYARVYDKGRETKTAPAGLLIRQELEYKGDRATKAATLLRHAESATTECHGLVSTYMRQAGLQTTWYDGKRAMAARDKKVSNGLKLGWLRQAARPSVVRLCNAGRLEEVLDALGLSSYVRPIDSDPVAAHEEEDS